MINEEVINRKMAEACAEVFSMENLEEVLTHTPDHLKGFMGSYLNMPAPMEDVGFHFGLLGRPLDEREALIVTNVMAGRAIMRRFVASILENIDFEEVMFHIANHKKQEEYKEKEGMNEGPSSDEGEERMKEELKRILETMKKYIHGEET